MALSGNKGEWSEIYALFKLLGKLNDALDGGYLVQIFLTCVLAVHEFQNLVASALGREVDMFTEVGLFGYGLQDVLCHVFGVGSGKSYAHIGHGLCHHVQQLAGDCGHLRSGN